MKISSTTTRALKLIDTHTIDMSGQFARLMWPDAAGWSVCVRTGPNGVSRGRQMKMAGGAYLARLVKAELIRWSMIRPAGYVLTQAGKEAIK